MNQLVYVIARYMLNDPIAATYRDKVRPHFYQEANLFEISNISRSLRTEYFSEEFGGPEFVQLLLDAYAIQVQSDHHLNKTNQSFQPHPTWRGHFLYEYQFKAPLEFTGNYDNNKDFLDLTIIGSEEKRKQAIQTLDAVLNCLNIRKIIPSS